MRSTGPVKRFSYSGASLCWLALATRRAGTFRRASPYKLTANKPEPESGETN